MEPAFALKDYQQATLRVVRAWLTATANSGDPDTEFYRITRRQYRPVADLPGVPYACLRVPTGGGKTLIAAHLVGVVSDAFLKTDTPTALWLVPSTAILDQTVRALSNRAHYYRGALAERFGENVRVMTVAEALYAKRPDYDGGATIIIATIQSFRVTETEGRKVYDDGNGELMDHFSGLTEAQVKRLEPGVSGKPAYSLANVLRLRRPVVIVDEAHNARTDLSFATLARLDPSLVLEMTATPAEDSNILHHVSAAELKSADMVKLPIVLRGRPDWKDTVRDAKAWLDALGEKARMEKIATGEMVRPVMLLQAQPNRAGGSINVETLKKALIEDFLVPDNQIAIATGSEWQLDGIDLSRDDCPIRFVITVQALREGWDCPNAYVLCTIAEQRGSRAVEQILGRVMRLPGARRKADPDLNQAYAFAATTSFKETADALADGLVGNGFEKIEARELVRFAPGFEFGPQTAYESEPVAEGIEVHALGTVVAATTGGRVTFDTETRRFRTSENLTEQDRTSLLLALPATVASILSDFVGRAAAPRAPVVPASQGFSAPLLCVLRGGQLELFDRGHFLAIPWQLDTCNATAIVAQLAPAAERTDEAHLDIEAGKVAIKFIETLHEQLALSLGDKGWDYPALVRWLDRKLSPVTRPDVTQFSAQRFIKAGVDALMKAGTPLDRLARMRFRLVDAFARLIDRYRAEREKDAFEACLFGNALTFTTSSDHKLVFNPETYWPDGRARYAGRFAFAKHLTPDRIGDMNDEEEACALAIERNGKVKRWVRNLERRRESFRLQTSSDWFYPDFVAELADGRTLAVEYKGKGWSDSGDTADKEVIGQKWQDASAGDCIFVMAKDQDYEAINRALA